MSDNTAKVLPKPYFELIISLHQDTAGDHYVSVVTGGGGINQLGMALILAMKHDAAFEAAVRAAIKCIDDPNMPEDIFSSL
jgi:predicted glycosyltransferase